MKAVLSGAVLLLAALLTPSASRAAETLAAPTAKPRFSLEDIKGGALFRHGFSFGVAFQAHLARSSGRQANTGFGLTPFVAFYPRALFFVGPETSAYCASRWGGFDIKTASDIADGVARERTIKETGKQSPTDSEVKEATGWNIKSPGAGCWKQWFGAYVGVPSKFKADAVLTTDVPAYTEFNPIFSTGLIFSPSTYFSVLGGLTRSRIASSGGQSHPVTSISIGLGGSIEVVSLLVGK
ncbi:hypothetical protein [Pyxidicoccus xibeiensis]|uniref:hypothetical protein n=1 Tax=Pyxidicoccus xibeiensis TaxID=2906759 RepID=UPI0020A6DBC9|nr:hypothetical protein [Pyxidicoccus xibeiensis]MCP3138180.1 hypothetical protein [Pyxidicoccus xibeiensis]